MNNINYGYTLNTLPREIKREICKFLMHGDMVPVRRVSKDWHCVVSATWEKAARCMLAHSPQELDALEASLILRRLQTFGKLMKTDYQLVARGVVDQSSKLFLGECNGQLFTISAGQLLVLSSKNLKPITSISLKGLFIDGKLLNGKVYLLLHSPEKESAFIVQVLDVATLDKQQEIPIASMVNLREIVVKECFLSNESSDVLLFIKAGKGLIIKKLSEIDIEYKIDKVKHFAVDNSYIYYIEKNTDDFLCRIKVFDIKTLDIKTEYVCDGDPSLISHDSKIHLLHDNLIIEAFGGVHHLKIQKKANQIELVPDWSMAISSHYEVIIGHSDTHFAILFFDSFKQVLKTYSMKDGSSLHSRLFFGERKRGDQPQLVSYVGSIGDSLLVNKQSSYAYWLELWKSQGVKAAETVKKTDQAIVKCAKTCLEAFNESTLRLQTVYFNQNESVFLNSSNSIFDRCKYGVLSGAVSFMQIKDQVAEVFAYVQGVGFGAIGSPFPVQSIASANDGENNNLSLVGRNRHWGSHQLIVDYFERRAIEIERKSNDLNEYLINNLTNACCLFICPLNRSPILDPVYLDGILYERTAIELYLANYGCAPITQKARSIANLVPDLEMAKKIKEIIYP